MKDALATELKDAAAGQGNAIKKRDDTHKMAQLTVCEVNEGTRRLHHVEPTFPHATDGAFGSTVRRDHHVGRCHGVEAAGAGNDFI